ncbi:MAG: class V aminotransferase, partial [Candidatus Sedimenticola endophacoides]
MPDRGSFQINEDLIYLNHAAVAPWPRVTRDAVHAFAEQNASRGAADYPVWTEVERRVRQRLARLINAPSPDDIALLKSTSEGLSIIAHGLPWSQGDNVVTFAQEFPS